VVEYRVNLVASRGDIGLFEVAYSDSTEVFYANERRKTHLIPIIDHASKMTLEWVVGKHAVMDLALEAWDRTKLALEGQGAKIKGLVVHHDQDQVFTGHRWVNQLLHGVWARVSYVPNGARYRP